LLWENRVLRRQSLLVRVAPGAVYESHDHPDDEECYVVEGDLAFGDLQLTAGDYHLAHKGGRHPPARSRAGCLLFITNALPAA